MVRRELASQGFSELVHLWREAALRQPGETMRIGFAGDERVQHGAARDTQHVRDHIRELDVGRLEQLVDAVRRLDPISDEALPMPRQIAQVADGRWGDKARANKTMREALRNPRGG